MTDLSTNEQKVLLNKFSILLRNNDHSEALSLFKSCTEQEQTILFDYISSALKKSDNPAVNAPTVITIINRKLKNNISFNDFYDAWKPPVKGIQIEEGKHIYSYFDLPTRVINAESITDPGEILSIGLLYGENESQFQEEMQKREKTENMRREKILKVADKLGSNKYYVVLSDDILGS